MQAIFIYVIQTSIAILWHIRFRVRIYQTPESKPEWDEGGTRSGLLWEVERILDETSELPQVLLMENVPQVHGKKNIADFNDWINFLCSKGYTNYWQDLNAKNYGIPQNRNRTFMVSCLGNYSFNFPEPQQLNIRLKDMLEDNVDERYYLSESTIASLNEHLRRNKANGNGFGWKPTDGGGYANAIKTEAGYRPDSNFIIERSR
jgi:site-specific DNA-cytosine methylase